MEKMADVLTVRSIQSCASNAVVKNIDQQAMFYKLNCSHARMMVLAVKTEQEDGPWIEGLKQLTDWETEADLRADEFVGKLTVLAGSACNWEDLMEQACSLLGCTEAVSMALDQGHLARLSSNWSNDENTYLLGLDYDFKSPSMQLLTRRLPLLHGSIIRLHMLDDLLRDRDIAIREEKAQLEQKLIKILHSKLVMFQSTSTATDELEAEIEGLAGGYGMLVGNQKMIVDGIKRLELQLGNLERQVLNEPTLHVGPALFQELTESYQQRLVDLRNTHDELSIVREDYQAAIEVVQSKIDIMNSRTNIETQEKIKGLLEINTAMQKQSLVYQYAAGLIEFIVLAYYSHTLWSHLFHTAYAAIPSWIQLVVVFLFSGNTVLFTHYLAEYSQGEHHVRQKLIYSAIPLILLVGLVLAASMLVGSHGAAH